MNTTPPATDPAPAAPTAAEHELEQALNFLGHDARSGHSSTLALLDLHRIQPDPMTLPQLLDRIEANARRSLDTIDDFADLIRARRQPLRVEAFEWTDLLVEVVAEAWSAANRNGVRIVIAPGPASVMRRADRGLVAAVVGKLLRDAVGGSAAGAEVRCAVSASAAEVTVEIAEAAVPSPVPSAAAPRASRKVASSLVFARAVAERHGGQVQQATSASGRMTRVVVPGSDVPDSTPA